MSALPPELQVLVEGYRQILDQVDSGALDVDAAFSRLGELSATDGSGARWIMSPDHDPEDGVFLRTAPEGGPPAPAPPHMFVSGPAPSATTIPEDTSTVFEDPDGGGWTDQVDDLLAPPRTPTTDRFDDDWDQDTFATPFSGPNLGFPADVQVGAPTDTGWDTPPTPAGPAPSGPAGPPTGPDDVPGQSLYGRDVTPREGIVTRVLDAGGSLLDVVTGRFRRMAPGQRRTTIIGVACVVVVAVFLLTRGGDGTEPDVESKAFAYDCPAASLPITGAAGDVATLLGCLDSLTDVPGPAIAGVAVERVESGDVVYRPERPVTRAEAIHTAMRLYSFAGGPAAQSSTPLDVSALPDDQGASVQAAADLGLVEATVSDLNGPSTRGTQAVLLYRGLTRAGVIKDAPGGAVPSDAPSGKPEVGLAVASLRAAGIIDGAATDPFGFDTPMLVNEWVLWAGRASHEIRDPGSMARRLESLAAPAAGTDEGRTPAPRGGGTPAAATPGPERVTEVITAVISGDPKIASSVIVDAGDGATAAERTAQWVGFAQLGYTVAPQAAPAAEGAGAVQVWQVGPAEGAAVLTYKVTWAQRDSTWVLAGWPTR